MKKILFAVLIFVSVAVDAQMKNAYRNQSPGNTASTVNTGPTTMFFCSMKNHSADTAKLSMYDSRVATYTTTASWSWDALPGQTIVVPLPTPIKFNSGLQLRVSKGGIAGRADTYTVQPGVAPDVQIGY